MGDRSGIWTVLLIGALLLGYQYLSRLPVPGPLHPESGIGSECLRAYGRDLAAIDKRVAQKIRVGEIKSNQDLKAYVEQATKMARQRSFQPIGDAINKLIDGFGAKWDAEKAAQYFEHQAGTYGE